MQKAILVLHRYNHCPKAFLLCNINMVVAIVLAGGEKSRGLCALFKDCEQKAAHLSIGSQFRSG